MPFDGLSMMTTVEKLKHLRSLLDNATDYEQHSYCSCLYHRVVIDPVFAAAGLCVEPTIKTIYHFLAWNHGHELFGAESVARKRQLIDQMIAQEEQQYAV